jgi:TonB family protein
LHAASTKHRRKNLLPTVHRHAYYAPMILRLRLLLLLLLLLACRAAAQSDPQNTGAYRVGGSITAPKPTYAPDPEYSEEARKAKYQGTCVLWLVVDADGLPQKIKVQRALGMGLDEEAIKAVQRWRFQPATKDGQPVPVMINVEVNFRLYNSLTPHPDSAGQPPRFPGVNTSKYPLLVRVSDVSFSARAGATAAAASYKASITDAGQERQVAIFCIMQSSECQVLDKGTYPARWEENMKSLEILGLSGGQGKWKKTEYTVDSENR